jgi:hypothetical protein
MILGIKYSEFDVLSEWLIVLQWLAKSCLHFMSYVISYVAHKSCGDRHGNGDSALDRL